MAATAGSIIESASQLLNDKGYTTWPFTDQLRWLNDGILRIVQLKPESNAVCDQVTLAKGVKQTIPSSSIQFLSAIRNVYGLAINYVDKRLLDQFAPDWCQPRPGYEGVGETRVMEYAFDPKTPRIYYVYPYNDGTGEIEIATSKIPENLSEAADKLPLDDVFSPALIDYVVSRCLQTHTEARAREEADRMFSRFLVQLGLDSEVDTAHDPKETEGTPR